MLFLDSECHRVAIPFLYAGKWTRTPASSAMSHLTLPLTFRIYSMEPCLWISYILPDQCQLTPVTSLQSKAYTSVEAVLILVCLGVAG